MFKPNAVDEKQLAEDYRMERERQVAAQEYLHTFQAAVGVPAAQSIVSGLLIGLVAWWLASWALVLEAWKVGLAAFLVVNVTAWIGLLWHWRVLTSLEQLTGLDLNRDGKIGAAGKPPPQEVQVRISQVKEGGHFGQTIPRFRASREQLKALAEGVLLENKKFDVRSWCGAGKLFSVAQFSDLRDDLLKARTPDNEPLLVQVSEKSPNLGYKFTPQGLDVLQQILESGA